jgi:hypothetical protein
VDSSNSTGVPAFTAVRTEPYGQTFLVPTEEVPDYEALVESVFHQYQPSTFTEKMVTQSVVNYQWRLRRVDQLEKGLYAYGRLEIAAKYEHIADAAERADLIDADVLVKLQKEFKNVAQQRRHLSKMLKSETAHLNELLKENPKKRGLFLVPKRPKK